MKSKKFSLFLFIVQLALCLSLVVTASALESTDSIDVSYSAGAESLAVGTGETVTVEISIDKNAGFTFSKAIVTYDAETLTFSEVVTDGSAFAGAVYMKTLSEGSILVSVGDLSEAVRDDATVYDKTGCVLKLVFETTATDFETASVTVEVSSGDTIPPVMTDIFDNPYNVAGDTLTLFGPLHQHTAGEWVIDAEPDCVNKGSKHNNCVECGELLNTEEIAAKGHTPGDWIEDKAPSCTEEGSKHQVCAICNETIDTKTIEKTAHGVEVDAAVAPTCTATGLTEGSHCPACQLVHTAQEVVEKIDHKYNEGVVTTAPTAATEGVKTFTCTACPESYTETIAKLAPTMVEAGDKWNKTMDTLLVFRTDAAFADFTEVRINGTVLAAENYTVTDANGIKVELKREYLETLEIGEYKIEVASASGAASANFQIEEAPADAPNLLWLWIVIAVAVVAGAGVAVFFVIKKKKA